MSKTYNSDIVQPDHDSLEAVMGQIYTDLFNPNLDNDARSAFHCLLHLFNARLSQTTNNLRPTKRRYLYRLITRYLSEGVRPRDLTLITFNQDIQAEKILCHIAETPRWNSIADSVFCFPKCYGVAFDFVTTPSDSREVFDMMNATSECIEVLKLHGSMNWYSLHRSRSVSTQAMFRRDRPLRLTTRKLITSDMTVSKQGGRRQYALPAVVPPVSHKSAVLHKTFVSLWGTAEQRLRNADEIVVFGYSCPPLDFESANLLRRSQLDRSPRVSIIDPDPNVVSRFVGLMTADCVHYYSSADKFLKRPA